MGNNKMDGIIKTIHYGDITIELPYEIEYDKRIFELDSIVPQMNAMIWYAIKSIMEEMVKIQEKEKEEEIG